MSYYDLLPGETVDERSARWERIKEREGKLDALMESINKMSTTGRQKAIQAGFLKAWMSILFRDVPEDAQEYALKKFREHDSKLMIEKMTGVIEDG